ncbi:MAG: hypothetical protein PVF17_00925 [Ignavibacteria bacterium]|jgi:hypothetical protein
MSSGIEKLKGKIIKDIKISKDKDEIIFTVETNEKYKMYHYQDCCEDVRIEDICGDLGDIIGNKILDAYETCHNDEEASMSGTWTFYNINSCKGSVTIRWYGGSNGYYSESVDFERIK